MLSNRLKTAIFQDYVEDYSQECGFQRDTVKGKRDTLKRFVKFLGNRPFTADSCRAWIRRLSQAGWVPVSIKHEVRILRATIKFLFKRKLIPADFSSLIPYPKVGKKPLEIVPAEVAEKVILAGTQAGIGDNSINQDLKLEHRQALRFVLRTGLRSRELRDLRGCDINLEEETFFVKSKSGNIDLLPIPRDMLDELKKRTNRPRLFKVTRETLNKCLIRGCRLLGIKTRVRTHTLRHIFCTSLLKRGVPIQIVSRLMRHASVMLTDSVYSHYQIEDLSLALNSRHPLIIHGMTPKDIFQNIKSAVNQVDLTKDSRFTVKVTQSYKSLSIVVNLV